MKGQHTKNCSKCNMPTGVTAWYCCNTDVYFCQKCAQIKCQICSQLRTHQCKSKILSPQKKKCVNCNSFQTKFKEEYFCEQKCKQYYCHYCLLIFFIKYWKMINTMKRQYGKAPFVNVELRCGCEIQRRKIAEYISKYCYCCSQKIQSKTVLLKNGCRIKTMCFNNIKLQILSKINRQEQNTFRAFYDEIKALLFKCGSCNRLIEGFVHKVDSMALCSDCYQSAKAAQRLLQKKSPSNKVPKVQQKHVNANKDKAYQKQYTQKQPKAKVQIVKTKNRQSNIIDRIKQTNKKLNIFFDTEQHEQINSQQNQANREYSDQFRTIKAFTLNYNQKQEKMVECSQCKAFSTEENIFRTQCLQPSELSTVRIAQTQLESMKNTSQGEIKPQCKMCYYDIKKKLKREQQLKKHPQSASKRQEKKPSFQNFSPAINNYFPSNFQTELLSTLKRINYLMNVQQPIKKQQKLGKNVKEITQASKNRQ